VARALITGAFGFAGRHVCRACREAGDEVVELGHSRGVRRAELIDASAARAVVGEVQPDVVYHLAARAHVGRSWSEPRRTLLDNSAMTLNLLEAVRAEAPEAVVVLVSSGELYGPPESLPVDERAPLRPQNPYAVSKASSDLLGGFYADAHALRVVRARAFNHAGPGQEPTYALASFTRQVAGGLEEGADPVTVVTGNPRTRRDYTDVRDVARAYRALAEHGRPGTFNVCSGRSVSAEEAVAALAAGCGVRIDHRVDESLVRAHEVMEIRGSHERLHAATGWRPEIPLESTLLAMVDHWREELRAGRAAPTLHE
jgi:GDP-4-dehydro-6-deoxy-D-mannose reductase